MNVVVYCGAKAGLNPAFTEAAQQLGAAIGDKGHTLVFGAGGTGLMGEVATSAHDHGAQIIGIIPHFMTKIEQPHAAIDTLEVVQGMPERRQRMIDLGNLFVALPGGPGTLDEITEVIAYLKLGIIEAPCYFVNVNGYFDATRQQLVGMVDSGFLASSVLDKICFVDDPGKIFQ